MARDVSGVYTLPNPPVVTNTVISSTNENATRSDIASEITNSLDRSGRGGMLAPLKLTDGTPSLPGLTFGTDVNTGMYRITADTIGFAVGGALALTIAPTGVTIAAGLTLSSPILTATTEVRTPIVDSVSGTLILKGATVTAVTITGANVALAGNLLFNTAVSKIIPGATSLSHRNFADSADNLLITDAGAITVRSTIGGVTTLTAATSVVTPSVISTAGLSLTAASGNNLLLVTSGGGQVQTGPSTISTAGVFTPVIDSGTAGSLSLGTNNGTLGFRVSHVSSAVNFWEAFPQITANAPFLYANGSDANITGRFAAKGAGKFEFATAADSASVVQFQVLHTASATRNITVTGSNGGNPVLSTTAGDLTITPAVIFTGGVRMGGGAGAARIGGVANSNTTGVGNVGAGTDDLMTYTLPGNSIAANGKGVRITAWGQTANNANAKTLNFRFGTFSTAIALTISIAGAWKVVVIYLRAGTTDQRGMIEVLENNPGSGLVAAKQYINFVDAAEDDTGDIIIKFTAAATADNDVFQEAMLVEYLG